jgi:hypothetical protein
MRKLLLLLLASCAWGQVVNLSTPAPLAPTNVSATVNGFGSNSACYWIIARYNVGNAIPASPECEINMPNLGGANNVLLTWQPTGALTYDVLKTPDTTLPSSCANCLLLGATSLTSVTDTGQALTSYTVTKVVGTANANILIDNRNFATTPVIQFTNYPVAIPVSLIFPDGTVQITAGGGGGGSVTHTLGPLTSGQLIIGNGSGDVTTGDLTGAISTNGGTNTTLANAIVAFTNLSAGLLSGSGTKLCTVSGTLGSTHVVVFDASGNCIQSLATIDGSGNYVSPGSNTTGSGGTVSGASFFGTQASNPTLPNASGYAGIGVGTGAIAASYALFMPVAGPSVTNTVMTCPALSTGFSQCTFSQLTSTNLTDTTNLVRNNSVNTGTAAMTLDMSASTTANAHKVPVGAGLTAGADGVIAYDSTAKSTHVRTNGADSVVGAFASAPVGGKCAQTSGTTGLLVEAAAACGSGGGASVGQGLRWLTRRVYVRYPSSGSATNNTGNADVGASLGAAVSSVAASSTIPYGSYTFTANNQVGGYAGDLAWRVNTGSPNTLHLETAFKLADNTLASQRLIIAFTDQTGGTQLGGDTVNSANYFLFGFNPATNSSKFFCATNNGNVSAPAIVDTTIASDALLHTLTLDITEGGNAVATLDGTSRCSIATLPTSGTFLRFVVGLNSTTAANRILGFGPIEVDGGSN